MNEAHPTAPARRIHSALLGGLLALGIGGPIACRSTPSGRAPDTAGAAEDRTAGGGIDEGAAGAADHGKARFQPASFGGAGNFLSVHRDPRSPSIAYAMSDVAGVYRSTDLGNTWTLASWGLGNHEISSFAIDPFESRILYAGVGALPAATQAGIYISRNAGRNWTQLPASKRAGIVFRKYRTVDAIAPDPGEKGVLLAGSARGGVFRGTGYGARFTEVLASPMTQAKRHMEDGQDPLKDSYAAPVSQVLFHPTRRGMVYAVLYGAGVFESRRGGQKGSFKPLNKGLPRQAPAKMLATSQGGRLWVALAQGGIYRSDNQGKAWRKASQGIPLETGAVTAVAADPSNPKRAWAVLASHTKPSVWKTEDGGESWHAKPEVHYHPEHNPTRTWSEGATLGWWISVDPKTPRRLYYTDYWGIQRSDDGGESWDEVVQGAQNTCVTSLAVGPSGEVLSSHMDAGLLISRDHAASWQQAAPLRYDPKLSGHSFRALIVTAGGQTHYFAAFDPWSDHQSKILHSTDGENFRVIFATKRPAGRWMGGVMVGLAADPSQPRVLYAAQDGGQVLVSRDLGQSFKPTKGQPADRSFTYALAVTQKGHVFAGTLMGGLFRSTDHGASWQRVMPEHGTIWKLLPVDNSLYATVGDDGNLYRSEDDGASWQQLTRLAQRASGDGTGLQGMGIAIDPRDPKHILFSRVDTFHSADAGGGIVVSRDGGATWKPFGTDLPFDSVNELGFESDGSVLVGTWCAGIFRRPR